MMGLTTQLRYRNLLACTAVILGLLAAAWVMAAPDTTAKPATVDTSKEKTALSQAFRKSTELFSQNSDDSNKLDATIETAPLRTVLRQLSTVTGWRIFVEPGLSRNISAKRPNIMAVPTAIPKLPALGSRHITSTAISEPMNR